MDSLNVSRKGLFADEAMRSSRWSQVDLDTDVFEVGTVWTINRDISKTIVQFVVFFPKIAQVSEKIADFIAICYRDKL